MLFFLLFVGCFGSKVTILDSASRLSPTASTDDEIERIQIRKSDLFENIDHDDINPLLLNGTRGLPGLEIRINPNGFLFASLLASPIINNEIRRLRLPLSKKCFPMLDGCITISNMTISRYRCPQMVSLNPSPPNRLVLSIRNLDFEMKANVDGEIGMILPVIINNTVSVGVHQISATIQLTIYRTLDGSAHFRSIRCYVSVGFTDVFFKNSGLLGDVFNSNFRNIVAQQIRKQFPIRFCKMIRYIIEEKINLPLNIIPKAIPLKKLSYSAEKFNNSTELDNLIDDNMHQESDLQSSTLNTGPSQRVTLSPIPSTSDTDVHEMETTNLDSCVGCNSSNKLTSFQNFSALSDHFDK
ncbi:unnamed protein product, partial [Onchocerca ochengi]|uniref:BPI1 domain-containing protein n=1 Tax=Onchocerca ochengi TaxID=42157 RepID=A0A182EKU0_ONCOC